MALSITADAVARPPRLSATIAASTAGNSGTPAETREVVYISDARTRSASAASASSVVTDVASPRRSRFIETPRTEGLLLRSDSSAFANESASPHPVAAIIARVAEAACVGGAARYAAHA